MSVVKQITQVQLARTQRAIEQMNAGAAFETMYPPIDSYYANQTIITGKRSNNKISYINELSTSLEPAKAEYLFKVLKSKLPDAVFQRLVSGSDPKFNLRKISQVAAANTVNDYGDIAEYINDELSEFIRFAQRAMPINPDEDVNVYENENRADSSDDDVSYPVSRALSPSSIHAAGLGGIRGRRKLQGKGFAGRALLNNSQVEAGNDNVRYAANKAVNAIHKVRRLL